MQPARTLFLMTLVLGLALPGALWAQNVEAEIEAVAAQVEEARGMDLHLIAPRTYREASDQLSDARRRYAGGGNITEIRRHLQASQDALREALAVQEVGRVILRDAIAAREDAMTAEAGALASDEWEEAEETMYDAGRDVEKGDQNEARREAQRATRRYRAAELVAIRAALLGTARTQRDQARAADADEYARQTWQRGHEALQEAERILTADRYNREGAREQASAAAYHFQHARAIAERAAYVDDDLERRFEQVVLQYEDQLARIADTLGLDARFDDGAARVSEAIVANVVTLQESRTALQRTAEEREARVDALSQELATLQAREETVEQQLQRRRAREAALRRVRTFFTEEEADVLLRGEQLIVRLVGLNFQVGSAIIQPQYFPVLTNVQRALREFPEAPVEVAGHTDSQGGAATNQRLSEQRANAVRSYLLANMTTLAPDRIRAVGYGESRPIASNDTAAGRQQNRRIDVLVDLSTSGVELSEAQ